MSGKQFTYLLLLFLCFTAIATSCRKDEDIKTGLSADDADTIAASPSLGSFLATSGKLKIKFEDTTYVFDAEADSIAFVKVDTAGKQYFGITAINKQHTISFAISGIGAGKGKTSASVAGSQFLFNLDTKPQATYALSKKAHGLDMGKFVLKKNKESDNNKLQLKGNFTTYLAKGTDDDETPFYKVIGSFDLELN